MQARRGCSATLPDCGGRSLAQLFWRSVESAFHPGFRFGCLHPGEHRIELAVERVQLHFRHSGESLILIHGDQDGFRSIMPGNDHHLTVNNSFEHAAEFILGLSRGQRIRFDLLSLAISKLNHNEHIRRYG